MERKIEMERKGSIKGYKIKLFNYIPLLKIRFLEDRKIKIFLFGFIPIIKIKKYFIDVLKKS
jgi:hypothetical protein